MKQLFLFVFAYFSQIKASDTLTIRQVYNFDVGDTFDYYQESSYGVPVGYNCDHINMKGTQRNIILGRFDVADSITYIVYSEFTPYPQAYIDTVVINRVDSNLLDTLVSMQARHYSFFPFRYIGNIRQLNFSYNSQSIVNWDTIANVVSSSSNNWIPPQNNYSDSWFYKGLGMTYLNSQYIDGNGSLNCLFYQLVCYSKGNKHACGPNYLAGINDIEKGVNVKVYPNPASDQLHLSVTNAGQLNARFIITDILGQELFSMPVIQDESTLDISKFSQGIYTWKLVSENSVLKTGKVIKD